jgi:hypothetical protein
MDVLTKAQAAAVLVDAELRSTLIGINEYLASPQIVDYCAETEIDYHLIHYRRPGKVPPLSAAATAALIAAIQAKGWVEAVVTYDAAAQRLDVKFSVEPKPVTP